MQGKENWCCQALIFYHFCLFQEIPGIMDAKYVNMRVEQPELWSYRIHAISELGKTSPKQLCVHIEGYRSRRLSPNVIFP